MRFENVLRVLFIFAGICSTVASAGPLKEGVHFYRKGDYSMAVTRFTEHLLKHPGDSIAHYNLGDALYRLGKFAEAEKSFLAAIALSRDEELKEKAWFNLGNTYFRQGKLQQAIVAYRQALKIKPDDEDARKNLAYVENLLKKLKKMAQKTAKKGEEKKKEGKKGEKKELAEKKEKSASKKKQSSAGAQTKKGQKLKRGKKEISPEVARMLLRSLKEKRPQKKKPAVRGGYSAGPEW